MEKHLLGTSMIATSLSELNEHLGVNLGIIFFNGPNFTNETLTFSQLGIHIFFYHHIIQVHELAVLRMTTTFPD